MSESTYSASKVLVSAVVSPFKVAIAVLIEEIISPKASSKIDPKVINIFYSRKNKKISRGIVERNGEGIFTV